MHIVLNLLYSLQVAVILALICDEELIGEESEEVVILFIFLADPVHLFVGVEVTHEREVCVVEGF